MSQSSTLFLGMDVHADIGDLTRFEHPCELIKFLG